MRCHAFALFALAVASTLLSAADDPKEALWAAARKGDAAAVKALLDAGADVNGKTEYGATALFFAADRGHTEVVKALLVKKADVNAKDTFYGATPLTWAVMRNHTAVVGHLLEAGAAGGDAVLISAARQGKADLVRVILERGKPKEGTLTSAITFAEDKAVIELLTKAGAKKPEKKAAAGPPTTAYAGTFKNAEAGEIELVSRGDQIVLRANGQTLYTLTRDTDETFKPDGGSGTFLFKKAGDKVSGFVRKADGQPDRAFDRVEATAKKDDAPPAATVEEPAGRVTTPANWPQFRGPGAAGVADGQLPPTAFDLPKGKNVRWKTPVPGLGHSCPVVWGDRVYVTTAVSGDPKATVRSGQYGDVDSVDDKTEHAWKVFALDKATGAVVWERTAAAGVPKVKRHLKGTHANPTPATDGKHVVVSFGAEGLFCYDPAGKLLWKRDLGALDSGWFYNPDYQWGFGSSPVVWEDRVIVQCDVGKGSYLAAFALKDGSEQWRTPREEIPSWGTPTVIQGSTRTEVVANATKFAKGYDPNTGKELWRLGKHSEITVPTPFLADGFIWLCSGYRPVQPIYAVKPGATGDITLKKGDEKSDAIAWSKDRGGPYMPTPIVYRGHLYVGSDAGVLTCYESATGKKVYTERLGGRGGYTASPVAADGRLYFTSEEEGVRVVKAGPKFELLSVNPVGETCLATPAIADGLFVLRTKSHVVAFARP